MDSEVRENHELQEELARVKQECADAKRELERVASEDAATKHYDHLLSLCPPKERLEPLAITLQNLWMQVQEDAELARRINDGHSYEVFRSVAEGIEPGMRLLRDLGFGKLPKPVLAQDRLAGLVRT
jgi:hypothetical protein